jgi:tRNA U38,U39,U40 pseudouridine synthase TruA
MLGPEIAIHDLTAVPANFDARFSAVRRSYRYFIDEAASHDPLRSHWVWHRGETLDLAAMNQAAAAFVGPHDFASLCRASDSGGTERTVDSAGWTRVSSPQSPVASRVPSLSRPSPAWKSPVTSHSHQWVPGLSLSASSEPACFAVSAKFCHQMVRSMALCRGGRQGRAEAVLEILDKRDRNAAREWLRPTAWFCGVVEY